MMTDEQLQGLFAGIERHLDKRADEIEQRVVTSEQYMRGEMKDSIHTLETRLITEFHKWASPLESRLNTHRHWFYEVDAQVELLKHRVEKLEGQRPPE